MYLYIRKTFKILEIKKEVVLEILDELAEEYRNKNSGVLVIKNGEIVDTLVGLRPKEDYLDALDSNL